MRQGLLWMAAAAWAAGFSAHGMDARAAPMPAPYTAIPGPKLTEPEPPAAAGLPTNNTINATLIDGTKVQFGADGVVMVVAPDGTKTPAPDGMLTLRDGTPFVVKDGKRVSEY